MRARQPDTTGYVDRDGVRVYYEVHGSGHETIVFAPADSIVDSRMWKAQVAYLAGWKAQGAGHPACRVLDAPRTALEKSAAYRAYAARLAEAERRLAEALPQPERTVAPAVAAAG